MKKNIKVALIFISIITIIFISFYSIKQIYNLKETNIKENIIVSLVGKEGIFIINPNIEDIKIYNGTYKELENIKLDINSKIYSNDNKYYFNIFGIYSHENKLMNETLLCPIKNCKFFWTKDSNYLIRMDGHVVRMFGLFFSTPTVQQVIHIIEPSTKKSKQILLYDENGKLLVIDKILGYKLDN